MNFASLQFAGFLLIVFTAYWALWRHREWQNWLLLGCSYYFYACWDIRFLALIGLLTLSSFWVGARMGLTPDPAGRRRLLVGYTVFALGILAVFKYFNFFVGSAQSLLVSLGWTVDPIYLQIILPAAISFFTFESLSYVIEIHQGHLKADTRLKHYALFIAFFPKLVAGPIERPAVLLPQIEAQRRLTFDEFTRGLFLIALGLLKKTVADGFAPSVDSVYGSAAAASGTDVALATVCFAFQIYCDFSGYSDIARGVSKLFGIELSQNFRFPYFSSDPSEFWRRWHISLSSWLRDYLYIPLGGNRGGEARTRGNLVATMTLGGLWHGAAWNYVLWGLYQGLLLVVYRIFPSLGAGQAGGASGPWRRLASVAFFFVLVCYGWLLFRVTSLEQAWEYTRTLFTGPYPASTAMKMPPISAIAGVLLLALHDYFAHRSGHATFYRALAPWKAAALNASILVVTLMGLANARSAFIYFQF